MKLWRALLYFLSLDPLSSPDTKSNSSLKPAPKPVEVYGFDLPITDYGPVVATQVLVNGSFGNSWGKPAISKYTPPAVEFNRVTLALELDSDGVQYDRLAHVYINNVEIWRPSTPEPGTNHIHSMHRIDVSLYNTLFHEAGEAVLELNNLITGPLTGVFNVTVSASYYSVDPSDDLSTWFSDVTADTVVLLVGRTKSIPPAVTTPIPTVAANTTKAILRVFASGNANEEFWYADSGSRGPLRLLEVSIGGNIAGYIAPFPVVYTGGFQPRLWRPFVGTKAFEVPAYEVDVTPFLPLLWNGCELELRVVTGSLKSPSNDWIVSASLLTWETPGTIGHGVVHTGIIVQEPSEIDLDTIKVISNIVTVNTSAAIDFGRGLERVESLQYINVLNVHVLRPTTDIYTLKSVSNLLFSDGTTANFTSEMALILNDWDITLSNRYKINSPKLAGSILTNASWGGDTNGTDALVRQMLPVRHEQHAVSRNGVVLSLGTDDIQDFGMDSDLVYEYDLGMVNAEAPALKASVKSGSEKRWHKWTEKRL